MATDGWYPAALDDWAADDGGAFVSPVTVGVLHTTESRKGSYRRGSPTNYGNFGHASFPHFTCDVQGGVFRVWQHISIRRAAKALRNMPGGVQTNREGTIQLEIIGRASSPFTNDDVMVQGLKRLMRWIESQTDIPPRTGVKFHPYPPDQGARLGREPWRMDFNTWVNYQGWCGHQHTPENNHGDCGAIDFQKLLPAAFDILDVAITAPKPIPPKEIEVPVTLFIFADPRTTPQRQYVTDMLTKRWLQNADEYQDVVGALNVQDKPRRIDRIVLDPATIDAIPSVGLTPTT